MGVSKTLVTEDGFALPVYWAEPTDGDQVCGLVLLHEIFGVTEQMKSLADRLAMTGYRVLVPNLFARAGVDSALAYDAVDVARDTVASLDPVYTLQDLAAAVEAARSGGGVAAIGYCWGGGLAYRSACELPIDCAVSFYGTRLTSYLDKQPACPVQFHFGEDDAHISASDVEAVRAALPGHEFYVYAQAGHAFANDMRPSFNEPSRDLAEQRMFEFIADKLEQP